MHPEEQQIRQLAEPVLASVGLELVQVECLKMKARWVVRIYMDRKEGGVTLDDCALISNQLGDLLDVRRGLSEVSGVADQPPCKGKDRRTATLLWGNDRLRGWGRWEGPRGDGWRKDVPYPPRGNGKGQFSV
jgi:hypothetical protein